jgi:hypothetical protein
MQHHSLSDAIREPFAVGVLFQSSALRFAILFSGLAFEVMPTALSGNT